MTNARAATVLLPLILLAGLEYEYQNAYRDQVPRNPALRGPFTLQMSDQPSMDGIADDAQPTDFRYATFKTFLFCDCQIYRQPFPREARLRAHAAWQVSGRSSGIQGFFTISEQDFPAHLALPEGGRR